MSYLRLLSALLCLGVVPAFGAELELIQSTAARHGISLNGPWRAIVDPYESGYYDYRYKPQADGGFGANKKPQSKSDLIEYDFDTADRLQVPGDWNTQRPDLMLYEGTVWYKRDFDCPVPPGHRIFVWFGAANYRAMVFLNGAKVGEHEGGFTPFQFEITGKVRDKGNVVIVKVDDQRKQDFIPTVMTDWWNYGGLTRSVRVIDVPGTFVQDYSIQLEKGSQTHVAGWVRLNGAGPQPEGHRPHPRSRHHADVHARCQRSRPRRLRRAPRPLVAGAPQTLRRHHRVRRRQCSRPHRLPHH